MKKLALLIGVSEYKHGLSSLPAATRDVETMQRVLLHPEIGGFDNITPLVNPQRQAMAEAIETMFDGRQKDDLVHKASWYCCCLNQYSFVSFGSVTSSKIKFTTLVFSP
ncbi:caspase family protein [Nostoc sp. CHAB 5715]|uniref:caspase family protein n=1 Tax=Nostoc sp. CHAB 5715 TaxID=2780400 RepID=UPI001E43A135|nr:caspase family protein [Nostoc sp. CHAB 5715]MCC5626025.1 caspase family protein [Nostoc sp. CHAB 5715]